MKKTAWMVACLMVVGQPTFVADAAQWRPELKGTAKVVRVGPDAPAVVGTVQYDTGVNAGFHPDSGLRVAGNRFNSHLGGPLLMTGMVSMATIFPQNGGGPQYFSLFGPPNGTTAMLLMFFLVSGVVGGAFNTFAVSPAQAVGPDFLGMWMGFFGGTPSGLLGMDNMTNPGQVGFHAMSGLYSATNGGIVINLQNVANRNAMFRATGDILVPVELMDFKLQ